MKEVKEYSVTIRVYPNSSKGEEIVLDLPMTMNGERLRTWLIEQKLLSGLPGTEITIDLRRPPSRPFSEGLSDGDIIIVKEILLNPKIRSRKQLDGED